MKKVVVVSEAGPPLGKTLAEGGGLRAWGIARSLADKGFEVTYLYRIGYEERVDQLALGRVTDIQFSTWDPAEAENALLKQADFAIIRHSHGEASVLVDQMGEDQILVVDCYIPIHVEVSARDTQQHEQDYHNFVVDDLRWTRILSRGDYFLYASENQKMYLMGLMAGVLLLNPVTYRDIENRFIKLPYCFFKADAITPAQEPDYPSLLWYGGLYSWFDIGKLVPGLLEIKKAYPSFKFLLAGAKNPYVGDKTLVDSYNTSMKKLDPVKGFIIEIPHQEYTARFDTYAKASAIVYVNKQGLENSLAWRTRLVDYILARKPIITNGGDPLGEDIIQKGLGLRFDTEDPTSLLQVFKKATSMDVSKAYSQLLTDYSWEENIIELANNLKNHSRLTPNGIKREAVISNVRATRIKMRLSLWRKIINYTRTYGFKKMLSKAMRTLR